MKIIEAREGSNRPRVRTLNEEESKTVQSDRNKAEITSILAQYQVTGIMPHMANVELEFRDVTEFEDFADLMRQSQEAEKVFMGLPSKLREVFDHDVMKWLDAAHDDEKLEALRPKLEELGVIDPPAAPAAPAAPPAPPVTPPPPPPAE